MEPGQEKRSNAILVSMQDFRTSSAVRFQLMINYIRRQDYEQISIQRQMIIDMFLIEFNTRRLNGALVELELLQSRKVCRVLSTFRDSTSRGQLPCSREHCQTFDSLILHNWWAVHHVSVGDPATIMLEGPTASSENAFPTQPSRSDDQR